MPFYCSLKATFRQVLIWRLYPDRNLNRVIGGLWILAALLKITNLWLLRVDKSEIPILYDGSKYEKTVPVLGVMSVSRGRTGGWFDGNGGFYAVTLSGVASW